MKYTPELNAFTPDPIASCSAAPVDRVGPAGAIRKDGSRRANSARAEEVRSLIATGNYTGKDLATMFNLSEARISQIKMGLGVTVLDGALIKKLGPRNASFIRAECRAHGLDVISCINSIITDARLDFEGE